MTYSLQVGSKQTAVWLSGKKINKDLQWVKVHGVFQKERENSARSLVSCTPVEIVLLGQKYPKAQRRCVRLKASIPK